MERRCLLNRPIRFANVEHIRLNATNTLKRSRHSMRASNFNFRRNITQAEVESQEAIPVVEDKMARRRLALQKYKKEKEAIKQSVKDKMKPPFKVGIPHHGNSPILREITNTNLEKNKLPKIGKVQKEPQVRRVTRAAMRGANINITEKETRPINKRDQQPLQNLKPPTVVKMFPFNEKKSKFNFEVQRMTSVKKLTSPYTPNVLKRSARKIPVSVINVGKKEGEMKKTKRTAISVLASLEPLAAPLAEDEEITRRSLTEEGLNKVEVPLDDTEVVIPNKTTKRGKQSEENPERTPSNVNMEPETATEVAFQRDRLAEETDRLQILVEQWEAVVIQHHLPNDVADEVDSVVGQTKLLTRDKFSQFRSLIDQFEKNEGSHLITANDINGFWEMMYLQVEALTARFAKLQLLKENNWVQQKQEIRKRGSAKPVMKPVASNMSPSIRKFIQAKRCKVQTEPADHELEVSSPRKSIVAKMFSRHRRTRSNSLSPYIVMKLSGAGRSSSAGMEPPNVSETPKSILRPEIKVEHESVTKCLLFNDVKAEENAEQEVSFQKTPRRSLRLIKKSPTPMKCSTCESACQQSSGTRQTKASRKVFSLRPSKLDVVTSNLDIEIPKKTSTNKHDKGKKSEEHISPTPEPAATKRKRNTRRRVMFDTSDEEKSNIKLPVTPYRKSGGKKNSFRETPT